MSKSLANWHQGWGGKNDSFWCCYGTAIESFSKLGDSIYFHEGGDAASGGKPPQVWIVQLVSSTLADDYHGLNLTQSVHNVRAGTGRKDNLMQTTLTVGQLSAASAISADLTLSLRIPGWADASATTVSLNGEPLVRPGAGQVGTFLHVKRPQWKAGDVLAASFGMRPRFVKLNDDRDAYDHVGSLHYGPYLLVGLTNGSSALNANVADIDSWLALDPASSPGAAHELSFTATAGRESGGSGSRGFKLLPLNRVVDQVYTAHFNISAGAACATVALTH